MLVVPWDAAHFGARLRGIRLATGATQAQLGGMLGITRASIANVESGRQTFSVANLAHVSKIFEVNPGWMLFGPPMAPSVPTLSALTGTASTLARLGQGLTRTTTDVLATVWQLEAEIRHYQSMTQGNPT